MIVARAPMYAKAANRTRLLPAAGLVHLRQGGLTASDQMLSAEKAGAWSEALALYEQVRA